MMQPEQVQLVWRWIDKAEEDYRNAEYTLTLREECPVGTVCFHSQQCVEKYVKALLVCHSLQVPRSHDLVDLYHRIPPADRPDLKEQWLAILNRYAVEARYPGNWDIISRQEAEDALNMAQAIRRTMTEMLSRVLDSHEDR